MIVTALRSISAVIVVDMMLFFDRWGTASKTFNSNLKSDENTNQQKHNNQSNN